MAYNTRRIKKDLDEKPIPQVYNPVADEYEPLQGSAAGGNRVQLYDGDGNPVGVATDAKLEAARVLLASLDDKDFATQTTLAAVLAKLADPATATKQDAAKGVLDAISTAVAARATEATLAAIKDALTDGTQKVQLSGSLLERYGATEAQRPAANTVPTGTVYMAVQTQQMWQSDGSQWVVM